MPLSQKDVERFKKRLEDLKEQITNQVRVTTETVKIPDDAKGYSQHQADEGTDDFVRNVNLEVSDKEFKILRQIERALEKVKENTYGICDLTEEEIPLARLEAIPYATMTVKAQEKFEKGLI
jgi:DnaK suppressor protein